MSEFDYSRFWNLAEGWERGAVRVKWSDWTPDLSKRNERMQWSRALTRGRVMPDEPLRFRSDEGRRWCDWVGTTYMFDLVSDRFIQALRETGATGWTTFDVTVHVHDGSEVPDYRGWAVSSEATPDWRLSQPIIAPPKVPGGPTYKQWKGLFFDPATWDGSDVFRVGGQFVCTDRVYEALRGAEVTNVAFERIPDWVREWEP